MNKAARYRDRTAIKKHPHCSQENAVTLKVTKNAPQPNRALPRKSLQYIQGLGRYKSLTSSLASAMGKVFFCSSSIKLVKSNSC